MYNDILGPRQKKVKENPIPTPPNKINLGKKNPIPPTPRSRIQGQIPCPAEIEEKNDHGNKSIKIIDLSHKLIELSKGRK